MKLTRVLLADDHVLIRGGIRSLLEKDPQVEVVGEVSDGLGALRQAAALRPDLILMDIAMPRLNGLEVTARLGRQFPAIKVVILSMHGNEQYVWQALRSGAAGYLVKRSATAELAKAIAAISRGEFYLCAEIPRRVLQDFRSQTTEVPGPLERLTPRQREILQLIAEGETNKSIAQRLRLSVKTVEAHRTHLMSQLRIHDLASLVRFAVRAGVVPVEE
jgi:DNA-binding NarL/FixJ family response regulator